MVKGEIAGKDVPSVKILLPCCAPGKTGAFKELDVADVAASFDLARFKPPTAADPN